MSDAPLLLKKNKRYEQIEDTPDWEILDELDYRKEDLLVIKKRYSAFFQTNLDVLLKQKNVDTLVIAGVNTHACVRMTAIDAYQHDYQVIWPEKGINSSLPEFAEETLKYMVGGIVQMMSNDKIKQLISQTI